MMTRREAIATAVAGTVAVNPLLAQADAKPVVIDTHTHFYDPTRKEGVPWPGKDDKVLYRAVLPAEYKKLAVPHGITGTVVVEASPRVEDNQWLLDIAKDEPFLVGIVGNLSLTDKDFVKNLTRFARNPLFRGIRVNEAALRMALKDATQFDRVKALSDNGLTLDINGGAETFLVAVQVAEKLPKLHIVVNHMGNPTIDGKEPVEAWRKAVEAGGAASANVFCKMSALVEGSRKNEGKAPTDLEFYTPTLDVLWNAFGADRLVFGSNWPVSDNFAKFDTVYSLASKYVKLKGEAAFTKVFGTNAAIAYQLKPRS
ncbi:MAG: amidohydrolase family protein [Planctomycetes bacterium]|nr:amidohydrolase family protein [Planctomycetota bacterium]